MTQQLDFGELGEMDLPGQALENLVRQILPKIFPGCEIEWTGVGPDGQKDLKVTVYENGVPFSWLISCKNYPKGSVKPKDLPDHTVERLLQHKCDGFLLITTGSLSVGAKELLDALNDHDLNGKIIKTKYWDKTTLIEYLTRPELRGIVITYFPRSAKALASTDVLDSISLLGVLENLCWQNEEAAVTMAIALVEGCKNAVIAHSVTQCILEHANLNSGDFYDICYEVTEYGEQIFVEDAFCQRLTGFLSVVDNSDLCTAVMNEINYHASFEEAYVNQVRVVRDEEGAISFVADVHVTSDMGSISASVVGEINAKGDFKVTEIDAYRSEDDWDDPDDEDKYIVPSEVLPEPAEKLPKPKKKARDVLRKDG